MDEKKYPYIYLDFDETLVYTKWHKGQPRNVPEDCLTFKLGSYWYTSRVRPCALDLIQFCRSLSICRILTAATRDYVKLVSDHYGMGFDHEEIIDRDNTTEWLSAGWGQERAVAKTCIEHVNSILVDNQSPSLPNAMLKMQYLGIQKNRYVKIAEFYGGREVSTFDAHLDNVKKKIAALVHEILQ